MGKLENPEYLVIDKDKIHEGIRELAFVTAAMESADDTVLFIDPDKLDGATAEERLEQFQDQLENLKPGAYDAFKQALRESGSSVKDSYYSERAARYLPYAKSNIQIDGEEFCLIVKPSQNHDTVAEVGEHFFNHYEEDIKHNIINNLTLSDHDWNKYLGQHEGEHCNAPGPTTSTATLTEETRADRSAWSQYDDKDTLSSLKDIRRLSSHKSNGSITSATHATAPWNEDHFIATPFHLKAAEIYRDRSNSDINNNFNWERYSGEAQTAEELLKENPELYFNAMNKAFDETEQEKHYIRDWALERIEEEKNTQELEQNPSVTNNTAQQETIIYTAHLKSALPTGEPSYDQTGNLTVSETSLPDTFKQSAQPETYGISYQNEALEAHETPNTSSPSLGARV